MELSPSNVISGTSLPHTKVRSAISPLNVVDKILYEVHLIHCIDHLHAWRCHLSQHQKKQRCSINLQMRWLSYNEFVMQCGVLPANDPIPHQLWQDLQWSSQSEREEHPPMIGASWNAPPENYKQVTIKL